MEKNLVKEARLELEGVTFDVQCFISEHAQFLSPAQSSCLLKFLTSTQRAFNNQTERLFTQRSVLDVLLDSRERQKEEEVCFMDMIMFPQGQSEISFADHWNILDNRK